MEEETVVQKSVLVCTFYWPGDQGGLSRVENNIKTGCLCLHAFP